MGRTRSTTEPQPAGVHGYLGHDSWLKARKICPRAIEIQRKAVELQPQDPAYRLSLARMYVDLGDKGLASRELDRLAKLGNKFPRQDEVAKLKAQL
jgi:predicted Zn-dependent protease